MSSPNMEQVLQDLRNLLTPKTSTQKTEDQSQISAVSQSKPVQIYYHLYTCTDSDCVESANPQRYAVHMRGVHSSSPTPLANVPCVGCGKTMKIAQHGSSADSAKVENMHDKYVIYPVDGQQEDSL